MHDAWHQMAVRNPLPPTPIQPNNPTAKATADMFSVYYLIFISHLVIGVHEIYFNQQTW